MGRHIDADLSVFLISDIARLAQSVLERRMSAIDHARLTPGEARTLVFAALMDGAPQSQLALRMHVDPMTVSGYADKLEESGLVERLADPCDRRVRRIVVTKQAREVLDLLMQQIRDVEAAACEGLSTDERATLVRVLKTMRTNMCTLSSIRGICPTSGR